MNAPHLSIRSALDRRTFLRGLGTCIALPALDAMRPAFAATPSVSTRRFVAMNASLGFHTPFLFPETEGREYALTPYLEKIKDHLDQLTLLSGLSHPNQTGNNGHASEATWLTSAQRPGLAGFKNTISLDQLMVDAVRGKTRIPYLALSTRSNSLSWTASGVPIPPDNSPAKLFQKMFINGTDKEVASELRELKRGRSILDTVLGDARRLQTRLGARDKEKLEQYFHSVRELEQSLEQSESWATKAKPDVAAQPPRDIADKQDILGKQRQMYQLMALALQSDSTRIMTFDLGAMNAAPTNIPGVSQDWHNLSHHGKDEAKIKELQIIEENEFVALNEFLTQLRGIREGDQTLLDETAILFGSNLGNASAHDWRNLPILVAGGGFTHQGHVAHDRDNNTPLANLFVTLAQRMGVETDRFGSSTAAGVRGLETL